MFTLVRVSTGKKKIKVITPYLNWSLNYIWKKGHYTHYKGPNNWENLKASTGGTDKKLFKKVEYGTAGERTYHHRGFNISRCSPLQNICNLSFNCKCSLSSDYKPTRRVRHLVFRVTQKFTAVFFFLHLTCYTPL